MSEHDDLIRALLVERFRPWPRNDAPVQTPEQLARAIAPEKRRPRRPDPRRRAATGDTIGPRRQP